MATAIAILYIIIIALAGLGIVVVKALGGEEVPMKAGTVLVYPADASINKLINPDGSKVYSVPPAPTIGSAPRPTRRWTSTSRSSSPSPRGRR